MYVYMHIHTKHKTQNDKGSQRLLLLLLYDELLHVGLLPAQAHARAFRAQLVPLSGGGMAALALCSRRCLAQQVHSRLEDLPKQSCQS